MRPRAVWRIARWEVTKNAGGVDARAVAILAVAVVGMGLVATLAIGGATGLETGIYRIGVDDSSVYYGPASGNPTFDVREPSVDAVDRGHQELRFQGNRLVDRSPTAKGDAALASFRTSVDAYNDALMRGESNQSAAFPVAVTLTYAEQTGVAETLASASGDGASGGGSGAGASGDGSGDGRSGGAGGTAGGTDRDAGSLGGLGTGLGGGITSGAPSDIAPPFPFESLVLAFLFVVPLNFVIQAYGSSILGERLNRRGELLLVSPVTRGAGSSCSSRRSRAATSLRARRSRTSWVRSPS